MSMFLLKTNSLTEILNHSFSDSAYCFLLNKVFKLFRSSTYIGLVFSGKISNAPLAHVLMLWRHSNSTNAKLREKNEIRRYYDYFGIITTEYKWTTEKPRSPF